MAREPFMVYGLIAIGAHEVRVAELTHPSTGWERIIAYESYPPGDWMKVTWGTCLIEADGIDG